jgi:hypothetical protein
MQREERPASGGVREVIKTVKVAPSAGALVMWLTLGAKVTVTRMLGNTPGKPDLYDLGETNKLTLRSLTPGKYQVKVTHPDYDPFTDTVVIGKGEVVPLLPPLISKYGSIIVGGVPRGSKLALDGKELKSTEYKTDEQGRIVILRVLVGKHTLKASQVGYDDWTGQIEVKPGEPTPETAILKAATVALSVRTKPGAQVYLDNVSQREVPASGLIVIPGLAPGQHRLHVSRDGFERADRQVTLTLSERSPVIEIDLVPIAESSEAALDDINPQLNWIPKPANWSFEKRGIVVRGENIVFFKGVNERGEFNKYGNFTMDLGLSLAGGKGAAWIVRAKDDKNYYLFELVNSRGSDGEKKFNFYICKDGVLSAPRATKVVEDIDNPKAFLRIKLEVRGNRFKHDIKVTTDKEPQMRPLGDLKDDRNTFSIGGVGFRGGNGMDPVINELHLIPEKKVTQ